MGLTSFSLVTSLASLSLSSASDSNPESSESNSSSLSLSSSNSSALLYCISSNISFLESMTYYINKEKTLINKRTRGLEKRRRSCASSY
jgi:hypothetical protein